MASGCKTLARAAFARTPQRSTCLWGPVPPAVLNCLLDLRAPPGEATPETRSIMSDWFERLVGFRERDANDVRALVTAEGADLVAPALSQRYKAGAFRTPSLGELELNSKTRTYEKKTTDLLNVIGDAGALHGEFPGATFQVASQFNCLEFVGPSVTPGRRHGDSPGTRRRAPAAPSPAGPRPSTGTTSV